MANDYGIKITKPGYDVATAGDGDLIFSSSWPSLPIVSEGTVEISSHASGSYTHNLNRLLFTQVWLIRDGVAVRRGMGESVIYIAPNNISIPAYDPSMADPEETLTYHVKCYNIDLDTEQAYSTLLPAATQGDYDPNYGIKVARSGEDIASDDMRDFILHSRCQSPLILTVKTEASAVANEVEYTEDQGYRNWVFGYIKTDVAGTPVYYSASYFSQAYPRLFITQVGDNFNYSITYLASDDGATLLVLRDPMFVATNVEASY